MLVHTIFTGGPFIMKEGQDRYILVGILHGSFVECSNHWPTIYTRVDKYSILKFVRRIVFKETIPPLNSGNFQFYSNANYNI